MQAGLNQTEIGRQLGCSQSTISREIKGGINYLDSFDLFILIAINFYLHKNNLKLMITIRVSLMSSMHIRYFLNTTKKVLPLLALALTSCSDDSNKTKNSNAVGQEASRDAAKEELGNSSKKGIVQGTVFSDHNTNDIFDDSDSPIIDVKVYADLNNNAQFDESEPMTLTDNLGMYSLEIATEGKVNIRQELGFGWRNSLAGKDDQLEAIECLHLKIRPIALNTPFLQWYFH